LCISATNRLRMIATGLVCLSIGIAMAATSAGALSSQNEQLSPVSVDRTPQSAIDEEFAILRAYSIDITRTERPAADSCRSFHSAFLNPQCTKFHKRKLAHVRRVATYVPAGHAVDR
jgi:hypothetical protein